MKKRILFVDDDPGILSGIRAIMHGRRKVWTASFAESGEDALALMEQETFDAVVADMRMPGMSGDQLLAQVQELYPDVIRIVLSGYSEMEAIMNAVKPAHQFLSKPCRSEVLISTLNRAFELGTLLADPGVRKVVSRLHSLPALPEVYVRLVEELDKPEPSLDWIGRLVERDPAVSASLLKLVNSSFFGLFQQVNRPSRAVALLGTETLKGVVLGAHFLSRFTPAAGHAFSLARLWAHSHRTAHFAREIATLEGFARDAAEECFLAGLLHDVGKQVLATELSAEYTKVLEVVREKQLPVFMAEKEILGVSHAELGAYLLGLWGVSSTAVWAVHAHHDLTRAECGGFCPAVAVHAANRLEHELVVVNPGYTASPFDDAWFEKIGFGERVQVWREACQTLLERKGQ